MRRLTALLPFPERWVRAFDIALALGLALANVLLNLGAGLGSVPALVALPVPLIWRRSHPLPSAVATAVLVGAMALSGPSEAGHPLAFIAVSLIAIYSVAAYEQRLLWALSGGGLLALAWSLDLIVYGPAASDDEVWPFRIVEAAIAWLVGRALHRRSGQVAALDLHARQLREAQEHRAAVAVAEERARLARELHDVVAHNVSLIVVQAGAAEQVLADAPERALEPLQNVQRIGRQTIDELRRLLGILRDHTDVLSVEPQPTLAQLDSLVEHVQAAGTSVSVERRGDIRSLPASLDLSAYRILQEGLTNVVKHAGAAGVRVLLDRQSDGLLIEVRDDGRGSGGRWGAGGLGLVGMRERVALLGGTFDAGDAPGGGFRLRAFLPLDGLQP